MYFVNSYESDDNSNIEIFYESDSSTNSCDDPETPPDFVFQKTIVIERVEEVEDNPNRRVIEVKERVKRPSLELYRPGSFSAYRLKSAESSCSPYKEWDEREEESKIRSFRHPSQPASSGTSSTNWSGRLRSQDNRFKFRKKKMSSAVKDTYRPDEKLKYFKILKNLNRSCSSQSKSSNMKPIYSPNPLKELQLKYDCKHRESMKPIFEEKITRVDMEDMRSSEVEIEPAEDVESSEMEFEENELPGITPQMEEVILRAKQSRGEVLVDSHKIQITRKDIDTLHGLNWLNDGIINFYLQMIVEQRAQEGFKVYATSTFFYPKMMSHGQPALKRWTKGVDIFDQDLMLIPVHLGMHWALAVVDFRKPGVYYYDSMGGNNTECLTTLIKYLQDEYKDKKGGDLDARRFEAMNVKDIPQQMNGSDCGMFVSKFAEYISRDAAITFSQEDMPYFRKRMIWEIIQDTLLHP